MHGADVAAVGRHDPLYAGGVVLDAAGQGVADDGHIGVHRIDAVHRGLHAGDQARAVLPPSRAVLRPTRSLAWMPVVPS
jgi:hypothetical protein